MDQVIKELGEKCITEDKHNFIKNVLSNLFIYNCMDAVEFNLTIRSLADFLKK